MKMKKVILASFMTAIMLMVPLTASSKSIRLETSEDNDESGLIEDRLGWVYDATMHIGTLILDLTAIINILPEISDAKQTSRDLKNNLELRNACLMRLRKNVNESGYEPLYNINLFVDVIDGIIPETAQYYVTMLAKFGSIGLLGASILKFGNDTIKFSNWYNSDPRPWTREILIYGSVKELVKFKIVPIADVEITCRGQITTTDENGNFSLYVSSANSTEYGDPEPLNDWFVRNCTITATVNGETLISKPLLSLAFPDGALRYAFLYINKEDADEDEKEDSDDSDETNNDGGGPKTIKKPALSPNLPARLMNFQMLCQLLYRIIHRFQK
jgi:hypothetical protein